MACQQAELMIFASEEWRSSALGYSKGMSLLLLSERNEDKPMRVAWEPIPFVGPRI